MDFLPPCWSLLSLIFVDQCSLSLFALWSFISVDLDRMKNQAEVTFVRAGKEKKVSLEVRVGLVRQLAMGSEIRFWVQCYISESETNGRLTVSACTSFSARVFRKRKPGVHV